MEVESRRAKKTRKREEWWRRSWGKIIISRWDKKEVYADVET